MSDINNLPKAMPATTSTFQIDIVGETTGQRFLGEFSCKIPTLKDQSLISIYESRLNGDFADNLNSGVRKLHKYIAYLRYTITEIPPKFWRDSELGYNLRDFNVIDAVYTEVMAFEEKWLKAIWDVEDDKSEPKT